MHNPKFVLENKIFKIHWVFKILTAHSVQARKPDFVIVKKEKKFCQTSDAFIPTGI